MSSRSTVLMICVDMFFFPVYILQTLLASTSSLSTSPLTPVTSQQTSLSLAGRRGHPCLKSMWGISRSKSCAEH